MSYKSLFPSASEFAYMDTAAEGLPLPGCREALDEYYRDKTRGTPGRRAFYAAEGESREVAAALVGTKPENIAFVSSASEAFAALATGLRWAPGDEIIISDVEFPSNIFPWLRLRENGVKVVVAASEAGALHWERIAELISPRTRLVSLSLVSYRTGAYFPHVRQLAAEAHRSGALLCVDATQAFGRLPVNVEGVDYLMSSTFKWLMAPHGLAVVYASEELRKRLDPVAVGWYSVTDAFAAHRFEHYELKPGAACLPSGMPNFPSLYGLRESLRFLHRVGVDAIARDFAPLVNELREGFVSRGCDMLTPGAAEYGSGIVSFADPQADEISAVLAREGVIVWGGDDRVRASVHIYNDRSDIQCCLTALDKALASRNAVANR